jgi:hypothetical protein
VKDQSNVLARENHSTDSDSEHDLIQINFNFFGKKYIIFLHNFGQTLLSVKNRHCNNRNSQFCLG